MKSSIRCVAVSVIATSCSSFLSSPQISHHPCPKRYAQPLFGSVEAQIEAKFREKYPETKSLKFQGSTIELDDGRRLFYKVGTGGARADLSLLQYEAEGLTRLANAAGDALIVPVPWLVDECLMPGSGAISGFIVMDELTRGGPRTSESQRLLGKGLAKIHSAPVPSDWNPSRFGFPMDGCCGSLAQPNDPPSSSDKDKELPTWDTFWARERLGFQLSQCRSQTLVQELGTELLGKMDVLFDPEVVGEISPSLLHGDLWSGNHAVCANGMPCIYDPAAYYGHSEADFGIARMFGGLSEEFYDAYYQEVPRVEVGFNERALLYELHHHLNHMNMFGGSYKGGAIDKMSRLLRAIS